MVETKNRGNLTLWPFQLLVCETQFQLIPHVGASCATLSEHISNEFLTVDHVFDPYLAPMHELDRGRTRGPQWEIRSKYAPSKLHNWPPHMELIGIVSG